MIKGRNILPILGFIITCQLYGLRPKQLAKLRNLETQFNALLDEGPGANFGIWRAQMQGQVDQMRPIDIPTATYYQKIVKQLAGAQEKIEKKEKEIEERGEERVDLEKILAERDKELAERARQLAAREREQNKAAENLANRLKNSYDNLIAIINTVENAIRPPKIKLTTPQTHQLATETEKLPNYVTALLPLFETLPPSAQSNLRYDSLVLMRKLNQNFDEIGANIQVFLPELEQLKNARELKRESFDYIVRPLKVMNTITRLFSELLNPFAGIFDDMEMKELTQNYHQQQKKLSTVKSRLYSIFNGSLARQIGKILIHFYTVDDDGRKMNQSEIIIDPIPGIIWEPRGGASEEEE